MKIRDIFAVILIASAGQASASSALARIKPQQFMRTTLASSMANKKNIPQYMQKRNLTTSHYMVVGSNSLVYGTTLFNSCQYAFNYNLPFSACMGLVVAASTAAWNLEIFNDLESNEQEISDLKRELVERKATALIKKLKNQ